MPGKKVDGKKTDLVLDDGDSINQNSFFGSSPKSGTRKKRKDDLIAASVSALPDPKAEALLAKNSAVSPPSGAEIKARPRSLTK